MLWELSNIIRSARWRNLSAAPPSCYQIWIAYTTRRRATIGAKNRPDRTTTDQIRKAWTYGSCKIEVVVVAHWHNIGGCWFVFYWKCYTDDPVFRDTTGPERWTYQQLPILWQWTITTTSILHEPHVHAFRIWSVVVRSGRFLDPIVALLLIV